MPSSETDAPFRVVVAGGGVAGLEALLALRDLAGDRTGRVLLSPEDEFVYRPMSVAQPFARGHAQRLPLAELAQDVGAQWRRGALAEVDVEAHEVVMTDGDRLPYDALLVAVGAQSAPALQTATTWTPEQDPEVFGGLLRDLEEGYTKRVAFVVPPGNTWPLPAYELALMTAWDARGMGRDDVEITIYTPEEAPLAMFGTDASAALRDDLDQAGVSVSPRTIVTEVDRQLILQPGGQRLPADRAVALPIAAGPAVPGLPADRLGFIEVDRHGRVHGVPDVWAAGDAIAFPTKQGGLAAQEADAAAEAIAAAAGADVDPKPFHPVLRGVVLTGRGERWMRRAVSAGDVEGEAQEHALFWPPTKVTGRYLAPFLEAYSVAERTGEKPAPDGAPVELDLARDVPAAADALRVAEQR